MIANLVLVLTCVVITNAQSSVPGPCPVKKPMSNIDMKKYEGLWYEQLQTPEITARCVRTTYKNTDNGVTIHETSLTLDGQQSVSDGYLKIEDCWIEKFNDPRDVKYCVLETNYQYTLLYDCQEDPDKKVFSGGEAAHAVKRFTGLYTGPYFDPTTTTNITTQLGTHAYLPCKVKQLGNKSVSWIRRRDAHILTVDRYTFIADDRFQAFLVEATDTWTLQVKYVQARDAGQYECQVSTEPKMSHFITLNVVVPKIEIMGESDIYVKTGSTVSLKCVITQSLEEPAYIFWYHDGERVLEYDRSLIDINMERVGSDTTISTLVIFHARPENSGNYTCSPSNLDSASVLLHVLNGEHPAAMQRGKNSASPIPGWSHLSMGLGLAACTPPRFAFAVALTLAAVAQLLVT